MISRGVFPARLPLSSLPPWKSSMSVQYTQTQCMRLRPARLHSTRLIAPAHHTYPHVFRKTLPMLTASVGPGENSLAEPQSPCSSGKVTTWHLTAVLTSTTASKSVLLTSRALPWNGAATLVTPRVQQLLRVVLQHHMNTRTLPS